MSRATRMVYRGSKRRAPKRRAFMAAVQRCRTLGLVAGNPQEGGQLSAQISTLIATFNAAIKAMVSAHLPHANVSPLGRVGSFDAMGLAGLHGC
eukprot:SAG11_NODE_1869_length_4151_cov_5.154245_3_plen_94_part_00